MDNDKLTRLMDEIPFFKEMDAEDRDSLLSFKSHWVEFKPGEEILKEDEVDYGFFVLLDGDVSVMRSKPAEVTLAQLVPGSIFGEITMKAKRPRSSSIVADNDVSLLKVDGQLIDKLSPELTIKVKDQIIHLVITRLDEVNHQLNSFVR